MLPSPIAWNCLLWKQLLGTVPTDNGRSRLLCVSASLRTCFACPFNNALSFSSPVPVGCFQFETLFRARFGNTPALLKCNQNGGKIRSSRDGGRLLRNRSRSGAYKSPFRCKSLSVLVYGKACRWRQEQPPQSRSTDFYAGNPLWLDFGSILPRRGGEWWRIPSWLIVRNLAPVYEARSILLLLLSRTIMGQLCIAWGVSPYFCAQNTFRDLGSFTSYIFASNKANWGATMYNYPFILVEIFHCVNVNAKFHISLHFGISCERKLELCHSYET